MPRTKNSIITTLNYCGLIASTALPEYFIRMLRAEYIFPAGGIRTSSTFFR